MTAGLCTRLKINAVTEAENFKFPYPEMQPNAKLHVTEQVTKNTGKREVISFTCEIHLTIKCRKIQAIDQIQV